MNIVITGASRGLGKSIAEIFASEGHSLFLSSLREKTLAQTAKEISTKYPSAKIFFKPTDFSKKEQIKMFADWCLTQGTPDIIVNNVGSFEPGSVHAEAEGVLENMLTVNLMSAYHLTRALLPSMMKRKSGHIFNMCSISSLKAYHNGGAYSISKFALYGLSKNLREEMKPFNIKVTSVLPGAALTDSWIESGVAPDRIMEADDISKMVFAASKLSPQACVEEIIMRPQLGDL
ncbi:MAG: short-chain dehydrogenase [Bacteroidetes bacterium]|nr:MAG: short-chain dehydrogenase [Bacteroidota bacterium]